MEGAGREAVKRGLGPTAGPVERGDGERVARRADSPRPARGRSPCLRALVDGARRRGRRAALGLPVRLQPAGGELPDPPGPRRDGHRRGHDHLPALFAGTLAGDARRRRRCCRARLRRRRGRLGFDSDLPGPPAQPGRVLRRLPDHAGVGARHGRPGRSSSGPASPTSWSSRSPGGRWPAASPASRRTGSSASSRPAGTLGAIAGSALAGAAGGARRAHPADPARRRLPRGRPAGRPSGASLRQRALDRAGATSLTGRTATRHGRTSRRSTCRAWGSGRSSSPSARRSSTWSRPGSSTPSIGDAGRTDRVLRPDRPAGQRAGPGPAGHAHGPGPCPARGRGRRRALPAVTLAGAIVLAARPTLATVQWFQVVRRAVDYAIARPSREVFYTAVGRAELLGAKGLIDTAVYRAGDAAGAWAYGLLAAVPGLRPRAPRPRPPVAPLDRPEPRPRPCPEPAPCASGRDRAVGSHERPILSHPGDPCPPASSRLLLHADDGWNSGLQARLDSLTLVGDSRARGFAARFG